MLALLGVSDARASCTVQTSVVTTIQAAVNVMPTPLTGDYCITIPQNAYAEQVVLEGKDTAGFRIYLTSAPGSSPLIDPPGGSTAAFVVANASVTLVGLRFANTNSPTWAVLASSAVLELRGLDAQSPIFVSSQASVTSTFGPAFHADGEALRLQSSSFTVMSATGAAPVVTNFQATNFVVSGNGAAVFNTTATYLSVSGVTPALLGVVSTTATVTGTFASVNGLNAIQASVDGVNVVVTSVTVERLLVSGFSVDVRNIVASTVSVTGDGAELGNIAMTRSLTVTGDNAILTGVSGGSVTVAGSGLSISSVTLFGPLEVSGDNAVLTDVRGSTLTVAGAGARVLSPRLSGPLTLSGGAGSVVQDGILATATLGPGADQGLIVRSTASLVLLDRSTEPTLAYSFVHGSTAVVISGSTGAVVHSNVLSLLGAAGNGVAAGANVGVRIASNTILGGQAAVHLDRGNQGQVMVSSNVFRGGRHGLIAVRQDAGAQVHVTSNVINPALVSGGDSYGLRLEGLINPTSVYFNDVYHSTPSSLGGGNAFLFWARANTALTVHNNRLNSPAQATNGNLLGFFFENVTNARLFRNDLYLESPNVGNSYALQGRVVTTGLFLRENVFVTGLVGASTATLNLDASSLAGLDSDRNAFHSLAGSPSHLAGAARRKFPGAWRSATGQDGSSFAADPDWPSTAGIGDFHPRSQAGRWNPSLGAFVNDAVTSPSLALGSYAGTAEASLSFVDLPAGCSGGFNVKADGSRDIADLQQAVESLPRSAAVDSCVVIRDTETYAGRLTVEGLAQAADVRYKIMADPSFVSSAPVVHSLFIRVSSVTVDRLNVRPVSAAPIAVLASSMSIVLTTVTVDGGSLITQAGIRISSMGAVRFSSVAVNNAAALETDGLGVEVSSSWLKTSAFSAALRLLGGSAQAGGPLTVLGTLAVQAGTLQAGPYEHELGSDMSVSNGAAFVHQGGTLTFSGALNSHSLLNLGASASASFGHMQVRVTSVTYTRGFDALAWRFEAPGGTVTFAAAQTFNFGDFIIRGSSVPRTVVRSSSEGSQWLFNTQRSSVTAVWVRDSNALGLVHANDGKSLAGTNLTNWNFAPFLAALVPGESWLEGAGRGGSPTPVAAGQAFDVTVQAYDSSSYTVAFPAFAAALSWTEVFVATPPAQPLNAGATVFSNVVLRTAQTTVLSPRSTDAFLVWGTTLTVNAGAPARMQVLLTGEEPLPGSATGKFGSPDVVAVGQPAVVRLRQTDLFWNLVPSVDNVQLSTFTPLASNLPQFAALVAGATTLDNVIFLASGSIRLTATDLSAPFALTDISAILDVFTHQLASPTVTLSIPSGSLRATIGGEVSGTAADGVAVSRVSVAVRRQADDLWYDWLTATFAPAAPVFGLAVLEPDRAQATDWSIALPDANLTDGTSYYVVARATNPSSNLALAESTFTYSLDGLQPGSGGDGAGTLALLPSSGVGCDVEVSTLVYTAGPAGLSAGGSLSIRLPDGWTKPSSVTFANPPANSGEVRVHPADALVELDDGWIRVSTPLAAGGSLEVKVRALRMSRSQPQLVQALSRGAAGGQLLPLASLPAATLAPGLEQALAFTPDAALTMGPLQTGPTLQLRLTDLCGTDTIATSTFPVMLAADPQSLFYSTGGVLMPLKQVPIAMNSSRGQFGFYLRPSTSAVRLAAYAAGKSSAALDVNVLATTLAITGVSVDTGTLNAGVLTATMTSNPFSRPAFVNFTVPAGVPWQVLIATSPDATTPLARRAGQGPSGRGVTWTALDERSEPRLFVAPGRYFARIEAGGGTAVSTMSRVFVDAAAVPSLYGTAGSSGAFARVAAHGPGAGPGSFAVASSTGFFQVFGLQAGSLYELRASSGAAVWTATGTAGFGGVDVGTLTAPTNGRLRLSVGLPLPSPGELWGRALIHDAAFSGSVRLALRFSSGSSVSDDGAAGFGVAAATWAVAQLPPGTYDLELDLPEVRLSTRVTGLSITAGGTLDLSLPLARKPTASGRVLLPETPASPVTVALSAGGARGTALITGSSAAFSLFGLDAGTVTVTAAAEGYRSASTTVVVGATDLGGLELSLSTAGIITGLLVVSGDTLGPGGTFQLVIDGYHPATSARARATATLARTSTSTSANFTLAGLADGAWELSTELDGFVGGRSSAAAGGAARLDLVRRDAWTSVTVRLPGGPHPPSEFRRVALAHRGDDGLTRLIHDLLDGTTAQYFASSATVRLGGLPPGRVGFTALYAGTGATARASRLLTQGATEAVTLDLSVSTYVVSGSAPLSGTVIFSSAGYAVSVSSAGGLLAQSATAQLCVLGSSLPVRASGFHVQLVPLLPGFAAAGEVRRSTDCAGAALADDEAAVAYIAPVAADGTFELRGVPAGLYAARTSGDLDGDLGNGLELPVVSTTIVVAGDVSGLSLRVDRGRRLAGRVTGAGNRPFVVTLLDASGSAARSAAAAPDFDFRGLPAGEYTLAVEDPGSPKVYAARPRPLALEADVLGLELPVEAAGAIVGRLALEAPASSAAAVSAVAEPWFHGGAYAGRLEGARFVVEGLPPGTYELRAQPADARFAVGSLPGVTVGAGRVVEVGALAVPLARELRGLVTGGTSPVAGVPVQAVPSYRVPGGPPAVSAVTGLDGRYVLRGLDPRAKLYDVTAAARLEHDPFGAAPRWKPATVPAVDVTSGVPVDFALSPALWSIRGRVSPAPARLTLQRFGELKTISAFTLHDGSFELPSLATGSYRLTASADGRASLARLATITAADVDVGTITLSAGAVLTGRLLKADGSTPSIDEVRRIEAAAPDVSESLPGFLSADNSEYEVSGFRPGRPYRLLAVGRAGEVSVLADVSFSTSPELRRLDVVYRAPKPAVLARARRSGSAFDVSFEVTSPLRARGPGDDDLTAVLSTFSAAGALSQRVLHDGRSRLTAVYTPAVGESSFTLRFSAYVSALDPDSTDKLNREHLVVSTVAFFTGVEASHRAEIPNLSGGAVGVEGDAGRVSLPPGAFVVDASSSVQVTLHLARSATSAAPAGLMRALAAAPPEVPPFSAFYNVLLPPGSRSTLARPAPLSVSYSTGTEPSRLNLYWYNPASNSYVLQQDVTGAPPLIDAANRTITVNVDHFSTFVLFEAGVNVIGGSAFGGGGIEAYNFPNPFDLREKTVTTIHGGGTPVVRGTMIRFSLPADLSGTGTLRIYDVAGRRVRELDLGHLSGGSHYYQPWDGRTDSGADAASGVYIGVVKVGSRTRSFKMALIK